MGNNGSKEALEKSEHSKSTVTVGTQTTKDDVVEELQGVVSRRNALINDLKVKLGKRERELDTLAKDLETERYESERVCSEYNYQVKTLEARLCWWETNDSQWQSKDSTSEWKQLQYVQEAERKKQTDEIERRVGLEEEIRARVKEELNKRQN